MISSQILRESENASSSHNVTKAGDSARKLPRMKSKALGDVQNTLHCRPENFINTKANSAVKVSNKISFHSKLSSKITASERKINVTPMKSARAFHLSTPNTDDEIFEIHNHILCEKDHQSFVNDYFANYKFSEEQISNLTHSVKNFVIPIITHCFEPCEEIEIPAVNEFEKQVFSVSDIFNDLIIPQIPPPLETL